MHLEKNYIIILNNLSSFSYGSLLWHLFLRLLSFFFMNDILILNRDLLILYGNQINIVLFWICFLINDRNRNLHIVKSNRRSRKRFLLFKGNVSNLISLPKLNILKECCNSYLKNSFNYGIIKFVTPRPFRVSYNVVVGGSRVQFTSIWPISLASTGHPQM